MGRLREAARSVPHRVQAVGRLARTRQAAEGAVVLAYHDVVADGVPAGEHNVTAGRLRSHIRLLDRLGLRVVRLAEIAERLLAGRPVDGLAAITFDDALSGVHDHALPVLFEEGVPATVFAVSSVLGEQPPWWPGSAPTVNQSQLRRLVAAGIDIGSHTRTHPSLPALGRPEARRELRDSRAELEDLTGRAVEALAYPHGHHDPAVREQVAEAGYRTAVTFLNGRITGGEDVLRLPRLTMGPHSSPVRLALQLARPAASWPDHQLDRFP